MNLVSFETHLHNLHYSLLKSVEEPISLLRMDFAKKIQDSHWLPVTRADADAS